MQERRTQVLVVESNAAARDNLRVALGEYYNLTFVDGLQEALATVRFHTPDLLVTELDLTDGDGLSLCAHIRADAHTQRLPIMVLTHRAGIQDKVAGFQAGADDYVVKPLDTRLFYARVRLLCRIKGLERPA